MDGDDYANYQTLLLLLLLRFGAVEVLKPETENPDFWSGKKFGIQRYSLQHPGHGFGASKSLRETHCPVVVKRFVLGLQFVQGVVALGGCMQLYWFGAACPRNRV